MLISLFQGPTGIQGATGVEVQGTTGVGVQGATGIGSGITYRSGLIGPVTLMDNTTEGTVFSRALSAPDGMEIHYTIARGSTFEKGILNLITDGSTSAEASGSAVNLGTDTGITFSASYSSGSVNLLYTATATGQGANMIYYYESWLT